MPLDDRPHAHAAADYDLDPMIVGVGVAVPDTAWDQADALAYLADRLEIYRSPIAKRIFRASGVTRRHIAMTPTALAPGPSPQDAHDGFQHHAPALAQTACARALAAAGLRAQDIDGLVVATSTGYLCPGVGARIAPRLGLPAHAMRTELVGAGCAAALPALQRAYDHVRAHPERTVAVVCVEVCSACFFVDDDVETMVGNAICADGAAAVIVAGARAGADGGGSRPPAPRLQHFRTACAADQLDLVGFAHPQGRLRIVLSKHVPDVAPPLVGEAVAGSLAAAGLELADVDHWIVHSGGKRVLDRLEHAFAFGADVLAPSRKVLAAYGNMSSPTVLFVLARHMNERGPQPGEVGVIVALGPGLVAEAALVRW